MWFNIYTLPKNEGIRCDHCGTYIRNVAEIHNSDGFVYRVGLDCFRKLMKKNKFSDLTIRTLNRFKNELVKYEECRCLWERSKTLDDLISENEKHPKTWLFVMWGIYGWKTEKQEEITQAMFDKERKYILESFIPARVAGVKKEMEKKFARVNVQISNMD